jgi:hypothetical protein
MGTLRREKDSMGRYILDLLAGPLALTADGSPRVNRTPDDSNTFGIIPQETGTSLRKPSGRPDCETTQCPAGTTVVMSITAGAAFGYTRLGMLLQYNPWGDAEWSQNYYTWRCEERIALTVPRPSSINIVTRFSTN